MSLHPPSGTRYIYHSKTSQNATNSISTPSITALHKLAFLLALSSGIQQHYTLNKNTHTTLIILSIQSSTVIFFVLFISSIKLVNIR